MKLGLVGDSHGNMQFLVNHVIPYAKKNDCQDLVQLGDFGFVWPDKDYPRNLDKIERKLAQADMNLWFLPGNHDDHQMLARIAAASSDEHGHVWIRPRLAYLGRVNAWTWGETRFGVAGGAVSVDREWRWDYLRKRPNRRPIWWPTETLDEEEVERAKALGKVDVLLTHDAPTSWPLLLKPDLDSAANRQRMTDIGRALQPKLWFHGHYHIRRTYDFRHDGGVCEVHAMSRDGNYKSCRPVAVEFLEVK